MPRWIDGPDRESVLALISSRMTRSGLARLLMMRFGVDIDLLCAGMDGLETARRVLEAAETDGWASDLIASLPSAMGLHSVDFGLFRRLGALPTAFHGMVEPVDPFTAPAAQIAFLTRAQGRVFSVEIDQRHRGTGFLIGPDLALTNYHVIASLLGEGRPLAGTVRRLKARFDYVSEAAPSRRFDFAEDWLVAYSPHHPLDCVEGEHDGSEFVDALDYAVLRLNGAAGQTTAPGQSSPRGWFGLGECTLEPTHASKVHVFGHPHGRPLLCDAGRVIWMNGNGTRLRYRLNTTHGVSGGPCVDVEMGLVALHSSGDPSALGAGRRPEWNQGVPIRAIADKLRERSLGELCLIPYEDVGLVTCVSPREPVLDRETLQKAALGMCGRTGSRVLLVDGETGAGRQFAVSIIRKLTDLRNQTCISISLEAITDGCPGSFCETLALELGLAATDVPARPTDRQPARWSKLLGSWIAGHARTRFRDTDQPLWLVVDCVEAVAPTEGIRELLAEIVERGFTTPELRVVIVGGATMLPARQREIALREWLVPIVPDDVSRYLLAIPAGDDGDLTQEEASRLADEIFAGLDCLPNPDWRTLAEEVQFLRNIRSGDGDGA